jgi:hypothetical protein
MENKTLTAQELTVIQDMNAEFSKLKMAIGDLEMQKSNILKTIEMIRSEFGKHESALIEKYGKDSVINIQTGEVTNKQE